MLYLSTYFEKYIRWYALVCAGVFFVVLYLGTNHFSIFSTRTVPLFFFERSIQFLPWTTFIYVSSFLQIPIIVFLLRRENLQKFMVGLLSLMFFHALVFLFLPTAYPRPFLPSNISVVSSWLYSFLVSVDTPKNCFPSQHVSIALFCSFVMFSQKKSFGIIFLVWTFLVIISTLTTKQHYFLDILGGLFTSIIAYAMIFKSRKFIL